MSSVMYNVWDLTCEWLYKNYLSTAQLHHPKKSLIRYPCHQARQSCQTSNIPISYIVLKKFLLREYAVDNQISWILLFLRKSLFFICFFKRTVSCNYFLSSFVNNYTANARPSTPLQDFLLLLNLQRFKYSMPWGHIFVWFVFILLDVFWASVVWWLPLICTFWAIYFIAIYFLCFIISLFSK